MNQSHYGPIPDELKPEWFSIRSVRSSGPGGQGVNTTDSKVELRFFLAEASWLNDEQKKRMAELFPTRINKEGEFILSSQVHRSQKQNLQEVFSVLRDMLLKANLKPRKRVSTQATRGSVKRRLQSKSQHSKLKQGRSRSWGDE